MPSTRIAVTLWTFASSAADAQIRTVLSQLPSETAALSQAASRYGTYLRLNARLTLP